MAAHNLAEEVEHERLERTLAALRETSMRWARRENVRPRRSTGLAALDEALHGGWPQGRLSELVGPISSGRTGIAMATLALATGHGEVVAWVDGSDTFDPVSASAIGMDLARVLWVRPRSREEAVRAVELVLEAGGFTVVVVDLAGPDRAGLPGWVGSSGWGAGAPGPWPLTPGRAGGRERRGTLGLRLARVVERAGVVGLLLGERPWMGTCAAVTVLLERGVPEWEGGEHGAPRWLHGLTLRVRLERGGMSETGRQARCTLSAGAPRSPVISGGQMDVSARACSPGRMGGSGWGTGETVPGPRYPGWVGE
jgi:recA bacterial DNA recombination protein